MKGQPIENINGDFENLDEEEPDYDNHIDEDEEESGFWKGGKYYEECHICGGVGCELCIGGYNIKTK